jgi:hypothetical protein
VVFIWLILSGQNILLQFQLTPGLNPYKKMQKFHKTFIKKYRIQNSSFSEDSAKLVDSILLVYPTGEFLMNFMKKFEKSVGIFQKSSSLVAILRPFLKCNEK